MEGQLFIEPHSVLGPDPVGIENFFWHPSFSVAGFEVFGEARLKRAGPRGLQQFISLSKCRVRLSPWVSVGKLSLRLPVFSILARVVLLDGLPAIFMVLGFHGLVDEIVSSEVEPRGRELEGVIAQLWVRE